MEKLSKKQAIELKSDMQNKIINLIEHFENRTNYKVISIDINYANADIIGMPRKEIFCGIDIETENQDNI